MAPSRKVFLSIIELSITESDVLRRLVVCSALRAALVGCTALFVVVACPLLTPSVTTSLEMGCTMRGSTGCCARRTLANTYLFTDAVCVLMVQWRSECGRPGLDRDGFGVWDSDVRTCRLRV